MGWDAFGLPTENYAIKNKIHPAIVTKNNIAHFKEQLKSIGFSFDWSREINTTDPEYYKWTQWIFLQSYKHGLAYKKEMPINWCPSCKVGLSNEEVVGGKCERCGEEVVRRVKSQWMLKITEYADRLISDLDDLDFIERVVTQQKNWIGRSEGASINFSLKDYDEKLEVFTTRPDTIYGATYMVIAPEHPLIVNHADKIENLDEINAYKKECAKKSEFERTELEKDKTGVEIKGIKAINPLTNKEIPIWISDYVLMTYGTGAIMAVPAHDDRDYDFAKKFSLEIIPVIEGSDVSEKANTETSTGKMINSGILNGLEVKDAIAKMINYLEENKLGDRKINYKLRDWVFSRQRYWGEPIRCEKCGYVALPEEELPLLLPDVENYEPTDSGESPLAKMTDWVNTRCPKCGGPAKRETDTMPQWAGSSWYFLRYIDPHNDEKLADEELLKAWLPVDIYIGGAEHAVLHLLYARFWHKFLYDLGVVPTKEPFQKLFNQGMILGTSYRDHRGALVATDKVEKRDGSFFHRVYRLLTTKEIVAENNGNLDKVYNETVKAVTEQLETMKFNTAIAQLMVFVNAANKEDKLFADYAKGFVQLLAPFAPHLSEELWQTLTQSGESISYVAWPTWDEAKLVENDVEIVIQIKGKVRAKLVVPKDSSREELEKLALANDKIQAEIAGKDIIKVIAVPNKLVNIVVK